MPVLNGKENDWRLSQKLAWTCYIYVIWRERNLTVLYMLRSRLASVHDISSRISSSSLFSAVALRELS